MRIACHRHRSLGVMARGLLTHAMRGYTLRLKYQRAMQKNER